MVFVMGEALPMSDEKALLYLGSDQDWRNLILSGWRGQRESYDVFWRVWWLEAELNNGGFHQFFFNSASDASAEILGALKAIGAQKTADLFEQACMAVFAGLPPVDRTERQNALLADEAAFETLSPLDDRFYAYEDDLTALLADYLRREGVLPLHDKPMKKGWFT